MGAPQHFAVYEIETAGGCDHEAKVVLDGATASALWPLSDTRCRWSFQVDPDAEGDDFPAKERDRTFVVERASEADAPHQLRRLLKARAPWFQNQIQEVAWTADVQFHPRLARQFGRNLCSARQAIPPIRRAPSECRA